MVKLQAEADALGKSSFAFAFYLDSMKEERARGVTIACNTKTFTTDNWHYTIIDAPGHRDFIKNMITGSSQADICLLMVPADGNFTTAIQKGDRKADEIQGQTRQHARLINLLGVKQLIVGVNKMDSDTAGYSKERFDEIANEMKFMLVKSGWKEDFVNNNVPIIPMSGYKGDNLIADSKNMPWYTGQDIKVGDKTVHVHTLLDALNLVAIPPERKTDVPLRVPVSSIYNIKGVGSIIAGRVEQGIVKPGQEVIFQPTHTAALPCAGKVFSIEMHHKQYEQGLPGDNIGMNIKNLDKNNMPKSGDMMILKSDTSLKLVNNFTAQVQTLDDPDELRVGYAPIGYVRTGHAACKVIKIKYRIGKETGGKKVEDPLFIKANEVAEIVFEPMQPLVCDTFDNCNGLGRVCFIDCSTVMMLGKIVKINELEPTIVTKKI